MKYKYHLTIRVDEKTYENLQKDSAKNFVKIGNTARRILEEHYECEGKDSESKTDR